jgi:hypothetical protein
MLLIGATALMMVCFDGEFAIAQQGFVYNVTFVNQSGNNVRCLIVDDESLEKETLPPGERFSGEYISNSQVLLIVYTNGSISGTQQFDPRNSAGISLTISPGGRLSPALRPRR